MEYNMNNESCRELTSCLCCGSTNLNLVLDLGNQPLANSFLNEITSEEPKFPLKLNICTECTHLQLSHAVDPDLLFKHYLYVSGTSKTLLDYFDWFARYTLEQNNAARSVLDIACNDGSQLNSFKAIGLKTYGIDPATNLHSISSANHDVVCDYFTPDHIEYFKGKHIDIITAQNVFAHNSDPLGFLKSCREIMHDKSTLFIQTSQADMVVNNEFDTIYHEHLSFFNAKSMLALAKRAGLSLNAITKTPIHGNSYVFTFTKNDDGMDMKSSVITTLMEEDAAGLQNMDTYVEYARKCKQVVDDLYTLLNKYAEDGYAIIGYGAAAKGNTLLNFGNIYLDAIIDDNPLKQGMYTPGMQIAVDSIEEVLGDYATGPIVFVPLAWNFFDEIKKRVKAVRDVPSDIFVRYFPKISIE